MDNFFKGKEYVSGTKGDYKTGHQTVRQRPKLISGSCLAPKAKPPNNSCMKQSQLWINSCYSLDFPRQILLETPSVQLLNFTVMAASLECSLTGNHSSQARRGIISTRWKGFFYPPVQGWWCGWRRGHMSEWGWTVSLVHLELGLYYVPSSFVLKHHKEHIHSYSHSYISTKSF